MTEHVKDDHEHEWSLIQGDTVAAFCQKCPQHKRMMPTWSQTGIATLSFSEAQTMLNDHRALFALAKEAQENDTTRYLLKEWIEALPYHLRLEL